jgi:hypothetical protein
MKRKTKNREGKEWKDKNMKKKTADKENRCKTETREEEE